MNFKNLHFINEKLRLFDSFAGVGALHTSLKEIGIDVELVASSEIDIPAILSYNAIQTNDVLLDIGNITIEQMREELTNCNVGLDFKTGQVKLPKSEKKLKELYVAHKKMKNVGDISKIDTNTLSDFDLFNISSPCQDFSVAGKQQGSIWTCGSCNANWNPIDVHYLKRHKCPICGSEIIEKTRSSLIVESLRIVREKKPSYIMIENVKGMIQKKFKPSFDKLLDELNEYGYLTQWKVLNAKDFGVPQNRERVFVIGIRKDTVPEGFVYEFPKGFVSNIKLKDIMEPHVDDKYYIKNEKAKQFLENNKYTIDLNKQVLGTCHPRNDLSFATRDIVYNENFHSPTLLATMYKDPPKIGLVNELNCERIGGIFDDEKGKHQAGSVWDTEGLAPTLDTMQGGFRQPCIIAMRGRYTKDGTTEQQFEIRKDNITNTITTVQKDNLVLEHNSNQMKISKDIVNISDVYKIRKLTPLECWRLMGFKDENFYKAKGYNSDTQLYKQAGNSIVVNVLKHIFIEFFNNISSQKVDEFTLHNKVAV